MDAAVRAFVEAQKTPPQAPTVYSWMKSENHEAWRTCCNCGNHFDLRKELKFECPSCGSKNLK